MIPQHVKDAVNEGLALLPSNMDSVSARVMLYAIGLQESRFTYRFQIVAGKPDAKGPARGYFQFEAGGGVKGVMTHPSTQQHAERICELRGVPFERTAVWRRLETDDVLAVCFARLLLWADPKPLPPITDKQAAWDCYLSAWRPGKPHRSTWDGFHAAAVLTADRRSAAR